MPAAQIKLNLRNRASRWLQPVRATTTLRNVQRSFQTKLLISATSAAITLLNVRFQASIDGSANSQIAPMSTTRPMPPTMQNWAYRSKSGHASNVDKTAINFILNDRNLRTCKWFHV